jgi:hypothetical protein
MAFTSTILDVAPTSVFTSNGNTAITTMYICNTGDIEVQFSIYAVPNGQNPDSNRAIYYRVPLTSHDTYVVDTEKLILEHGDALYADVQDPLSIRTVALMETEWQSNAGTITTLHWSSDLSQYMIGGEQGKLATSPTAESWTYQSGLQDIGWPQRIAVNAITRIPGGKYVVVGNEGHMAISDTGSAWTNLNAVTLTPWGSSNINDIASNGSMYMMVGDNSLVASSLDGINWTVHVGLTGLAWGVAHVYSIIWDGVQFVLGGEGGRIAFTIDGTLFVYKNSLRNNLAWGENTRLTSLIYSGYPDIGYLALSIDNNKVAWSLNGTTWAYDATLAALGSTTSPGISGVTYQPGYGFFAIGLNSEIYNYDSGRTWYKNTSLSTPPWNGIAGTDILWNPYRAEFMVSGYNSRLSTSRDAVQWTYRTDYISSNIVLPNVVVTVSSIGI